MQNPQPSSNQASALARRLLQAFGNHQNQPATTSPSKARS
jgi:hypothetical protein